MTDEKKPGDKAGSSAERERSEGSERVVIRDRRKIDPSVANPGVKKAEKPVVIEPDEVLDAEVVVPEEPAEAESAAEETVVAVEAEPEEQEEKVEERVGRHAARHAAKTPPVSAKTSSLSAETEALRTDLEERTRDLQRVTAEYANYRKRVERDRAAQGEQATGSVLSALLPVLDDLDRAREHGDLVGPFASVADQLSAALGKFGLTAFGEKGDAFDPNKHEAVAHLTSADVTEPTCIDVMRRGYELGNRLLRPALVAVADPE
ncbi:nucleotide exchange factor GrpE [Catenuloplanes japonicus]|uniref:nucleotide exchange factor GrpE n=1 Tax=Catenuloplanes japonicus TaxID=33876 RepID=UPI000525AF6F|nr:nucleotide exchange factor GrpE [Catenuloplanes japonicus]